MDSLRTDLERPRGLPRWLLWAALPVVVALGFVAGMALATYAPASAPPLPAGSDAAVPPGTPPATTGEAPPPQVDNSWRIATAQTGTSPANQVPGLHPEDLPVEKNPPEPFTGPANNIIDARKALAWDYGTYTFGGRSIDFEYQQMRQVAMGTSIVGMIDIEEYDTWSSALRQEPQALQRWLEKAAERVLPASTQDRFSIAWAVVDVVRDLPTGFADYEVTPLDNRSFLVIRPLAATQDYTKTGVQVRPLESLTASVNGQKVPTTTPWMVYGPVIRFNNTDLYRPARIGNAQPLNH